jgi:hypothetical protein
MGHQLTPVVMILGTALAFDEREGTILSASSYAVMNRWFQSNEVQQELSLQLGFGFVQRGECREKSVHVSHLQKNPDPFAYANDCEPSIRPLAGREDADYRT